jgi:hypothetical protein
MAGNPRWLILLTRLANRIYFAAARCLIQKEETRERRIRTVYGPSRRLVAVASLLWLVVVLALLHLALLLLHGLTG